jgi:uncharacterized alpha-E superfamily protein
MLCRIAEALFWIGRYVERADDTARILDAYMHRFLEDPADDEDAACRALYAILGIDVPEGEHCDITSAMLRLAYDTTSPSAICGALRAARDNARGAREVISSEMWECLNATWNTVPEQRRAALRLGPHAFLGFVRQRAALFSGLADATMSRDDGWRFVVLGRSLERVDMTTRLLSVRVLAARDAPDWTTLLRASGADESFRRTYGWAGEPENVPEFLLLDRDFPRSVVHALSTAETCLAELAGSEITVGNNRFGPPDATRRPIGRLRTRLEYTDTELLPTDLPALLRDLQEACLRSSEAVATAYFQYGAPVAWEREKV